jgi:type II secretory pathway pseudopilin PulG
MSTAQKDQRVVSAESEDGFGLVEIVVSMFLLALLAISFLPLLITSLKVTVSNTTIATATQLVNQDLEIARSIAVTNPYCSTLKTFATAAPLAAVSDPRGTVMQPHRSLVVSSATDSSGCPVAQASPARAAYPGTVSLRSWVTVGGKTIAEATTFIFVERAIP